MIELSHLYKTYLGPIHALRDVSFQINKGEFVFLSGPSGAGKSTLFRMIAAMDRPSSGHIVVGDVSLNELEPQEIPYYRRKIGVVFQDFKLLRNKTIYDNVALPLVIHKEPQSSVKKKVMDTLDRLGIQEKWNQYPNSISGGEQQRVAIARAIIHQPFVLIADEPTGNLDAKLSHEIMDILEQICSQGTTVFVATHDTQLLQQYKKRRLDIIAGCMKGDAA